MCTCRNISPEQELLSKGQVRGWLRSQTGFLSLCQVLSATGALKEGLLFSNPDISELTQPLCWSSSCSEQEHLQQV